jgi:hypothetical protein
MDMEKSYQALFELLWYSQLPCYDVMDVTSTKKNQFGKWSFVPELHKLLKNHDFISGMLKSCSWKGISLNCSSIFTMFPTDRGMCCSFNMEKADKMFRQSKYTEMMNKLMDRDRSKSFEDSTVPSWYIL